MIAAIFISLICHIFCFNSIEFTFTKNQPGQAELSKIFFLGPILQEGNQETNYGLSSKEKTRNFTGSLNSRIFTNILTLESSPVYELESDFKKPTLINPIDNKIVYFKPSSGLKIKEAKSSIMFHPVMPYHFLLYFKDRQTAHMEVAFYISSKGKVTGIKRKISSGNPEVDLLVMRNLTHFLNLCKSNFTLGFWQTVKVDLSR